MKAPNGYGSIYKLKGKRRRPYIVVLTDGWEKVPGQSAKRQARDVLGYYETYPLAVDALAAYHDNPAIIDKQDIIFSQLYDEWSKIKYKRERIAKDTENCYRAARKHLTSLDKRKVKDIRTGEMQSIVDTVGETKGRQTLANIKVLLGMMWDYAKQNDIVKDNYAKYIELPKAKKTNKDSFTEVEVAVIEKAAASGKVPFADCVLIMCYTGFRISELLSLTPFAYESTAGTLTGGMKTEAGEDRVIPVHNKIKPYIIKRLEQKGQRIVCRENGRPYSADYFRDNCYKPAVASMKIRPLLPHECRHTFATMVDRVSAEDKTKAMLLGHADYKISKEVYIHKTLDDLRAAINQLN